MKGPVFAIVAVLTLLSVAASCVLPLMWTRGEVVLREVEWNKSGSTRTLWCYREPAFGMALGDVLGVTMGQRDTPTPARAAVDPLRNHIAHGWAPLAHDHDLASAASAAGSRWNLGTGWPMICAIATGTEVPGALSSGPIRVTRSIYAPDWNGRMHDITSFYSNAFDEWPTSIQFPNLAINLLVHGLAWFLLAWLFVKGFRAFMPRVE